MIPGFILKWLVPLSVDAALGQLQKAVKKLDKVETNNMKKASKAEVVAAKIKQKGLDAMAEAVRANKVRKKLIDLFD